MAKKSKRRAWTSSDVRFLKTGLLTLIPYPLRRPVGGANARDKGRTRTVEKARTDDHAAHVLATFKTQREAIEWAKKNGHMPHVARVRHLNDKKRPDHWRAA